MFSSVEKKYGILSPLAIVMGIFSHCKQCLVWQWLWVLPWEVSRMVGGGTGDDGLDLLSALDPDC